MCGTMRGPPGAVRGTLVLSRTVTQCNFVVRVLEWHATWSRASHWAPVPRPAVFAAGSGCAGARENPMDLACAQPMRQYSPKAIVATKPPTRRSDAQDEPAVTAA